MEDKKQGIGTLCQIGIIVKDIEAAVARLSRIFRMPQPEITITDSVENAHTRYRGKQTAARARLAFFPMGQVTIELIEPVGEPSTWKDHLRTKGEGFHHIAFQVDDFSEIRQHLAENNVSIDQEGDYTGGRYTYCGGPELSGIIMEFLENRSTGDNR
ncbi:MAG: VOC family protein [Spirochaetales bacterium]|nr:VOC family protein [Spirochaetales bacterium]